MTLRLYNTASHQTEEFVAQKDNKVSLYTCGPTVYNFPHIGNWAAYIYWDILVRILMANNYNVTRVMNITDVGHLVSDADTGEDKLAKGARREGKTMWDVASFYTKDFINGIQRLGLIPPQYIARATDYIPEQLNLVRKLKEKGFTYQINDGVYFNTAKFPSYSEFAKLDIESQKAGARVEFNPQKLNSSDFVLWKFIPVGTDSDMQWDTPLDILDIPPAPGQQPLKGTPGWHLECSAIAMSLLGNTLDIHTGGIDHIPVHHTNEIAQSEAATGVKFCNYWLHNNHLKSNGTKISKSLGNGYTLDDLEKQGFSPLDFRMFVLQGSYRNEGNFTFDNLTAAKNRLNHWRDIASLRHQIHDTIESDKDKSKNSKAISYATSHALLDAIGDDLNTPEALKIIDESFSKIGASKLSDIHRRAFIILLETIDATLGLQLLDTTPDISDEAKQIILERVQARTQGDWGKSDSLRTKLESMNILIRDSGAESIWTYKI